MAVKRKATTNNWAYELERKRTNQNDTKLVRVMGGPSGRDKKRGTTHRSECNYVVVEDGVLRWQLTPECNMSLMRSIMKKAWWKFEKGQSNGEGEIKTLARAVVKRKRGRLCWQIISGRKPKRKMSLVGEGWVLKVGSPVTAGGNKSKKKKKIRGWGNWKWKEGRGESRVSSRELGISPPKRQHPFEGKSLVSVDLGKGKKREVSQNGLGIPC